MFNERALWRIKTILMEPGSGVFPEGMESVDVSEELVDVWVTEIYNSAQRDFDELLQKDFSELERYFSQFIIEKFDSVLESEIAFEMFYNALVERFSGASVDEESPVDISEKVFYIMRTFLMEQIIAKVLSTILSDYYRNKVRKCVGPMISNRKAQALDSYFQKVVKDKERGLAVLNLIQRLPEEVRKDYSERFFEVFCSVEVESLSDYN